MNQKAWVAKAAKQPMVLETVDLGPLPMSKINEAFGRLESGKGRYCIMLDVDF